MGHCFIHALSFSVSRLIIYFQILVLFFVFAILYFTNLEYMGRPENCPFTERATCPL